MITFQVKVSSSTFEELGKIAALSNIGMGEVVASLLKYWQNSKPSSSGVGDPDASSPFNFEGGVQLWRSSRGEMLPCSLRLRAAYLGKTYKATVTPGGIEFNGKLHDSPSSAAVAVKTLAGKSGTSASTNGWEFWEALDPKTEQWISIKEMKL
jgi:hypothetical protein